MTNAPEIRTPGAGLGDSRAGVQTRLLGGRVRALLARVLRRDAAVPAGETFDAFISYSHKRDGQLAAALKRGLHRFARPWYRLRALHVFLDNTNLAANPNLWTSITEALGRAHHLVLLASPEAASSPWVEKEIQEWRASRPADRVVLVLTDGNLRWDPMAHDFDWPASDAAPRALSGAFDAEPRWIDFRFAHDLETPSLRDPEFKTALADVAAPLHGRTKEELVGDDVREHRRTVRVVWAAVLLLLALTATAGFAAVTAFEQRDRAEEQLRLATSRFLSAEAAAGAARQHSQSLLLSAEALDASPTAEARAALYSSLVRLPEAVRYLRPRTGGPQKVALSPHGRTVVAGTTGGALEFWDARSGRRERTIDLGEGVVTDISFAPTGGMLAAVDGAGEVRLVDPAAGGAARLPRPSRDARANTLAFGPGGLLATGHQNGEIWLWDIATREPVAGPLTPPSSDVTDVALAPEGNLLAAGGFDGTVSVWDLEAGAPLDVELVPGEGHAGTVAFSPDGTRLAAGAQDGAVGIWATDDWSEVGGARGHPGGEVTAVAFSGDGTLLASGGFDNTVRLWDAATGVRVGRPLPGHIAFVTELAGASTAGLLASASADGNIVLWDPTRDDRLGRPYRSAGGGSVSALAAEPDGSRLAWVDEGRRVLLSDGRSTRVLLTAARGEEVRSVAFSPDGRRLAAGVGATFGPSSDTVHVWSTRTRRPVGQPLRGPPFARSLAFGRDGRVLLAGGFGRVFRLDLARGRRIGPPVRGHQIAVSPDGRLLAATTGRADDGTVVLWDARSGRRLDRLKTGRASFVWGLSISPDGSTLAAGDNDGNVILWDLATRRRLGEPLTGHRRRVDEVAFSPSGELLASADSAAKVLLWDVEARRALGPAVPGFHPSFGARGDVLATASPAGGIALRPLDPQRWRELACSLANRNLGSREWQQFMGTDPYDPTCAGRERGAPASVAVSAD
jgi:WD40 repeat protein